eukprot:2997453-Prymnesium_polylepis.1
MPADAARALRALAVKLASLGLSLGLSSGLPAVRLRLAELVASSASPCSGSMPSPCARARARRRGGHNNESAVGRPAASWN